MAITIGSKVRITSTQQLGKVVEEEPDSNYWSVDIALDETKIDEDSSVDGPFGSYFYQKASILKTDVTEVV